MIAHFHNKSGVLVFAGEIKPRKNTDRTETLPEIVVRPNRDGGGLLYYIMRGIQWNDHANRHELRFEEASGAMSL